MARVMTNDRQRRRLVFFLGFLGLVVLLLIARLAQLMLLQPPRRNTAASPCPPWSAARSWTATAGCWPSPRASTR